MPEGQPSQPIILFMSGDDAVVVRSVEYMKRNIPTVKLTLALPESVRKQYKLKSSQFKDFPGYPEGVIDFEYRRSDIISLSNNPERPRWIGLCHLMGYSMPSISKEMQFLFDMRNKMASLESENAFLRNEVNSLRNQLAIITSSFAKYKRINRLIYGNADVIEILRNIGVVPQQRPVEESK